MKIVQDKAIPLCELPKDKCGRIVGCNSECNNMLGKHVWYVGNKGMFVIESGVIFYLDQYDGIKVLPINRDRVHEALAGIDAEEEGIPLSEVKVGEWCVVVSSYGDSKYSGHILQRIEYGAYDVVERKTINVKDDPLHYYLRVRVLPAGTLVEL